MAETATPAVTDPSYGVRSDNRHFASLLPLPKRLLFWARIALGNLAADRRLKETLRKKECYYGPFKGEFGHFLAHNLPFLQFLHSKGVRIHYCGMTLHAPFLVDENGKSIVASYDGLRDFFSEVPPRGNTAEPPEDVRRQIDAFTAKAGASGLPFWNIGDNAYYWYIQRFWMTKGRMKVPALNKAYAGGKKENACVIFARRKNPAGKANNGLEWDYDEIAAAVAPYFEKVYVTGHPSQSAATRQSGNIIPCVTSDNRVIIEKCSLSRLIITQHSGAVYLSDYVDTPVLIIHRGEKKIGSLVNTLWFRKFLGAKYPFGYAFSIDDIVNFVKHL